MSGPSMIQIGTDGGFLPYPVVLPNTPIGYNYNRRDITVLNVQEKTLFLGPAERADVIIDFSRVPKNVSTVIMYNDAPAPVPGFDPRNDYYTNDPDQTSTGGAPTTLAGLGPNTRTVMQFRVSGKKKKHFNLAALQTALPTAYVASQPAPVVPQTTYPGAYQANADSYARIQDTSLRFLPVGQAVAITQPMLPKSIIESFDLSYGRMNSMLGSEMTFTNDGNQTSVPLEYRDPPVEYITNNGAIQLWKVTHNGVDTHAIHTHLFDMQLVNRVGWDGMIKPPDPNELGWKDTIRMNPLEDIIVGLRPIVPPTPFASQIPNSYRLWDPTMATGMTWSSFDPNTGAAVTLTNSPQTFGWEYVWHCHLLGHEENDMMRPISFALQSNPPILNGTPVVGVGTVDFSVSPPVGTTPATYEVTYMGSTGALQSFPYTGNPQTISITGLSGGQTYTFTVVAVYPTGQGTSMPLMFTATPL
jgi:FtsP/CotA-like multicopper oxidase with cupredoxin domain